MSAEQQQLDRMKSAMIVYQLERDLSQLVVEQVTNSSELHPPTTARIMERLPVNMDLGSSPSVLDVVEAAYLDDIFTFAISMSEGTAASEKILMLKKLCGHLELYEIRNAIAHPTRTFPRHYWFRSAAIANDPLLELIGLKNVRVSFLNAEKGLIASPPDDWLAEPAWQIPNNLPNTFEHDITGFVGRKDDRTKLSAMIRNPRHLLISVVGPGGRGKTAIIQELLKDLSMDPNALIFSECIVFISMRIEKLVSDGIKKLEASETIEQVKEQLIFEICDILDEELIDDFELLVQKMSSRKILIFLDNLETLIRDSPSDFDEFISSLPQSWRVIVTSRISVNAAAAYPLGELRSEDALNLARRYIQRRGVEIPDHEIIEKIVASYDNNPLAIRLCIDAISLGKSVDDAIGKVQGDVSEFSYLNLIDTFSDGILGVLEVLFIQNESSRQDIAGYLGLSLDEVSECIYQLKRTSLISSSHKEEQEIFVLNNSVQSYLRVSPKNLTIRQRLITNINSNKSKIEELKRSNSNNNSDVNSAWYVPEDLPENFQLIAFEVAVCLRRRNPKIEVVKNLYKRLDAEKDLYTDNHIYWKFYSLILAALNDVNGAISAIENALRIKPKDMACSIQLARIYHHNNEDFRRAEGIYAEIIEDTDFSFSEVSAVINQDVHRGLYYSLLFQHKYDKILELTKNWKKETICRGVAGSFRASAHKRKSEKIKNIEEKFLCLRSALTILDDVLQTDGASRLAVSVSVNIIKEYLRLYKASWCAIEERDQLAIREFLAKHLSDLGLSETDADDVNITILNEKGVMLDGGHSQGGGAAVYGSAQQEDELFSASSSVDVTIYHIPDNHNAFPRFVFGSCNEGVQYFLHFDKAEFQTEIWEQMQVGTKLKIIPDLTVAADDKSRPAERIGFVRI